VCRVVSVLLQVALTASVTQAISCAVIAIEITDDINYLLPCLLVAVIGSGAVRVHLAVHA
jgi:H+/Cl- antiporter ClcA